MTIATCRSRSNAWQGRVLLEATAYFAFADDFPLLYEKAIDKNGEPEMITVDKSGANWAALESLNAERSTPIKDR